MRPRSASLSMTALESTPRISSTSSRPTGWRYAMMASVSSAAGDRRRGRSANCARSIVSAYSRRVRNCHASAISTSSTPWSSVYELASSASAARTAPSLTSGSSDASSSSVSGRDAANNAASSSFARGCTIDHHGAERLLLRQRQGTALRELEQRDERREDIHERRLWANCFRPSERLVFFQQSQDPRGRAFHVERPRHHAMQHRLGRPGKLLQLDDETAATGVTEHGAGHEGSAPGRWNVPTSIHAAAMSWCAGHRKASTTPGSNHTTSMIGRNPNAYSWR